MPRNSGKWDTEGCHQDEINIVGLKAKCLVGCWGYEEHCDPGMLKENRAC